MFFFILLLSIATPYAMCTQLVNRKDINDFSEDSWCPSGLPYTFLCLFKYRFACLLSEYIAGADKGG